ncbi:uncharacterized protein LOC133931396 [Phragmites australis]|uniref:uncharacterized protein LOC133931396 n=1 Tax=Phragmites australis TaxID=29695 RepID=UPI002D7831D8|nr:uncharacterized protein LOC133931396 [Phragmites australis]
MSAPWPWVILGRVPRLVPGDAEAEAWHAAADFSIPVALPPRITVLTAAPSVHPDPNYPDKYPYIVATGPSCLLFNFAVEPFYGVNSSVDPHESYLILARRFHPAGVQQGHAATATAERIPMRHGRMPIIYNIESIGLVSSYDGDYTIAEFLLDKGSERAKLLRFRKGDEWWTEDNLIYPLSAQDREWVPTGVVAQDKKLWWFDLSWGLLSCDPFVADPVLLFHNLPEGRALNMTRPDIHTHRCITVSRRKLRYVEIIIPEDCNGCHDSEAATVSMWTRIPAPGGKTARWDKAYEISFAKIWKDDSYKATGLPEKVPLLAVVCPSNPDVVYFDLEQHLFGVIVPAHKVVKFVKDSYELVNMPWPIRASSRYISAWFLPHSVAMDLNLVGIKPSSSSPLNVRQLTMQQKDAPNAVQAVETDDEDLLKLGMEVAMTMDPATLKSEVDKFFSVEDHPSPERQVTVQKSEPFDFRLTEEEAWADVLAIRQLKKHRQDN